MLRIEPLRFGEREAVSIEVRLPKTNLLIVTTKIGYIMCGALDVHLLNTKLKERNVIAGRSVGVKTIDDLLNAPLESVTDSACALGIVQGTIGRDAVRIMLEAERLPRNSSQGETENVK